MFELSSETRVGELEAESPAMMKALQSTGIFRAGDDTGVTISDLCLNFGLHPGILLDTLVRARASESPSNIDVSELDDMTLTQVVENIETSHHKYLRETLPLLVDLSDMVVSAHGAHDTRLTDVQGIIKQLSADLENHMLHEEEALFPMVRDLDGDGAIKPTRCGEAVGGPIACMENEHTNARTELGSLRKLTDDYAVPDNACATYRTLLDLLSDFDQNMVVHMHKEDTVLFPRALEAQATLRTANDARNQDHGRK
jgi:regulator of cell morphogenesis and NO signaling